ncbi:hypothetical protein CSKR_201210 [Clonorchis sinensis]|uniref:Uncharacterized protein n=1 Tax=Clonorchis sinensis TaxID=79923 RepID=A0A8T1MNN7_CLOSI|nr:hypothetical protein CSKR_201210 [Clonorchis sinensis]
MLSLLQWIYHFDHQSFFTLQSCSFIPAYFSRCLEHCPSASMELFPVPLNTFPISLYPAVQMLLPPIDFHSCDLSSYRRTGFSGYSIISQLHSLLAANVSYPETIVNSYIPCALTFVLPIYFVYFLAAFN